MGWCRACGVRATHYLAGMIEHRPTVLLTGFGAFPGVPINATGELVPRLAHAARERFSVVLITEILPTEWRRAPERLTALIARHNPDIALHFGVSHRARGFAIEARGVNVCAPSPDACGAIPTSSSLEPDGPAERRAALPVARIVERLNALGLPAYVSDDAGSYICNALLFQSLACPTVTAGRRLTGFVHIPASLTDHAIAMDTAADCPLDWSSAVRGGLEILAVALDAMSERAAGLAGR